jgi:hypothetical protein
MSNFKYLFYKTLLSPVETKNIALAEELQIVLAS